ncbi:prephenate dehydrogenase [Methanobacterium aggregans]|uniref:prephenate dehydrogenase n=1 Tax=Methanobacterium aggregans TaxID=1615586 RepID=UPI001AE42570|nr:prephenate dehydrogenase [Methanobacterium aggregans]MBP2045421.1 prephenate dehydrogenase [Methanobacterium aggregans]
MKITIIGGTRGLGNWIARFLKNKGFDVVITGRNQVEGESVSKKLGVIYLQDNVEAASQSDVTIISVPIDVTTRIIKEVAPHLKEGSLLMDVTSVKEEPADVMKQFAPEGVEFLPTHPMFGPRIRSLDGQVVVLTPEKEGNEGKWYPKVLAFLESENARVLVTNPENHDKMMSIVQGLTHFSYISIAATIEKLGIDIKESRKFASPVYSLMLDMIARIVAQNPYLCYSIQTNNRYIVQTHEAFLETFLELKEMINAGREKEFVGAMSSAAKHLDDLEAALGRSDKAISALNEEVQLLKDSVGEEVGLRHIYSETIHVGILKELSPDFATLVRDEKEIKLKLSNVEVLSTTKLHNWKVDNYPRNFYDVSAVFPENCNPPVMAETLMKLDAVIEASVVDVYCGDQIETGKKSVTIRYSIINPDARFEVENLLKGFGGIIR